MKKKFTIIELLIVIAIIAIIASLLLPNLIRAKEQAKVVICISNLKQIHTAQKLFGEDNKKSFPARTTANYPHWTTSMAGTTGDWHVWEIHPYNQYLNSFNVCKCPSDSGSFAKLGTSYSINNGFNQGSLGSVSTENKYQIKSSSRMLFYGNNNFIAMTKFYTMLRDNEIWGDQNHSNTLGQVNRFPSIFVDGHAGNILYIPGLESTLNYTFNNDL